MRNKKLAGTLVLQLWGERGLEAVALSVGGLCVAAPLTPPLLQRVMLPSSGTPQPLAVLC